MLNLRYNLLLPIVGIFILGVWIQSHIFLSIDISWLLIVGKRMLAGGKYYFDFFEVNPPMAVYLYMPAIKLSDLFHWNLVLGTRVYIFSVIIMELIFCYILAKKLLLLPHEKKTNALMVPLMLALAIAFILLPAHDFGQREHFSLMLTFPYLLLLVVKIKNGHVSLPFRLYIGLLAGIGFTIKPHFLIPWLFIEIYYLCLKKDFFSSLRAEFVAVVIIGIIYLISLLTLTPEYIYQVLPIVNKYYYATFFPKWKSMLISPITVFWLITFLFYCELRKYSKYPEFIDLLILFATGFMLVFILQRTMWYYHCLPFMSLAFVLLVLLLKNYCEGTKENRDFFSFFLMIYTILFLLICQLAAAINFINIAIIWKNDPVRKKLFNTIVVHAKSKPVIFLNNDITTPNPLFNCTNIESASRFPSLWLARSIDVGVNFRSTTVSQKSIFEITTFLTNAVVDDFLHNKPALVIVDAPMKMTAKHGFVMLDYVTFFSQDTRFQKLWRNYHYVETIGKQDIYIFNEPVDERLQLAK